MRIFKKMKEILFEEEEVIEPIKEETSVTVMPKEDKVFVEKKEDYNDDSKLKVSEKELFKSENTFPFPDFDELEFESNVSSISRAPKTNLRNTNVLEFERNKKNEKRNDYQRYEKTESIEKPEKRKFKPSPIISPVYGILNQDYKPEDIQKKEVTNKKYLNVDNVRKKAFGELESLEKTLDKPVSEFYQNKETVLKAFPVEEKMEQVKTIDELLEDTADVKIDINDEFITDELNLSINKKQDVVNSFEETDTLETDLFDLIDSMYENKEEGE